MARKPAPSKAPVKGGAAKGVASPRARATWLDQVEVRATRGTMQPEPGRDSTKPLPKGETATRKAVSLPAHKLGLEHLMSDKARVEMREREIIEKMRNDPHYREAIWNVTSKLPAALRRPRGIKPPKGRRAGIEERGEPTRKKSGRQPNQSTEGLIQLAENFDEIRRTFPRYGDATNVTLAELFVRARRPDIDNDKALSSARKLAKKVSDAKRRAFA